MANILAVDDSESIRKMVELTLDDTDHDLTLAMDGSEAFNMAQGDQYDLVITDINMPNMNGFELIHALRKLPNYKLTPILCLTTESSQDQISKGKQAGASGWIIKPFNPVKLMTAIDRVV